MLQERLFNTAFKLRSANRKLAFKISRLFTEHKKRDRLIPQAVPLILSLQNSYRTSAFTVHITASCPWKSPVFRFRAR